MVESHSKQSCMPEAFCNWEKLESIIQDQHKKYQIWIYGWLRKIYVISFTLESNIGTLHETRLSTFISNLRYNECDTPYTSNLKIYIMMLKISCFSCWRFFNCKLSHRYVMKMYCPSITMLGYTSHSRKFQKLISINLNKKPIFRSSH